MKTQFSVIGLIVLTLCSVLTSQAQENALVVTQEYRIDQKLASELNQMSSNDYVPCHYRFKDTVARKLNGHTRLPLSSVNCFDINAMHFPKGENVRYDDEKKEWVKDFSERSYADEPVHYKILDEASRVYTIKAQNSSGFVYTEDELMGEESRRHRILHFCLLHSPIALCGQTDVMLLSEPENDRQPYIMEVLRSIEFIDDVSSEEADTPSSGPAASSASRP